MSRCGVIALLALTVFLSGCGPPGPRALLKGKRLLERGDYSGAVDEFKSATSLMSTNAQAWNYLGVAYQHDGRAADAALAYQRALTLDRDLVEAHYNFGCLWLEQNRPDLAKNEFTAYVLRRGKSPGGWTKLGVAELRLRDITSAEKSFSIALSIDPKDAEAFNGLGLDEMQRQRPRDAASYFAAAVKAQPDYAPGLLNLATVEHRYLGDDAHALQNYRAYLALTPRRPDWEQVNAIASDLEQKVNGAVNPAPNRPTAVPEETAEHKPTPPVRNQASLRQNVHSSEASSSEVAETERSPSVAPAARSSQSREKSGTLHEMNPLNWFRPSSSKPKTKEVASANVESNQTKPAAQEPVNPDASSTPAPQPRPTKRFHLIQPAPPSFPHYLYLSPAKPIAGDRNAAARAFARAQQFEQNRQYQDALDAYRQATELDPSWFAAQYNCGVMAYHLKDLTQSLHYYEIALAIQPDSEPARYNFALVLKEAGYVTDAVNELKKILALHPDDARAHLALGNLYAQQLYDYPNARAQYLEVLRLDPTNPQAADIQFWLSSNPP